jgi:hypothetical protein
MFNCDKCGECCKHLHLSSLYTELDRGDGVCKYLVNNLCSIYNNRPIKCRIDESYEVYFRKIYSLEEFYEINRTICNKLKYL